MPLADNRHDPICARLYKHIRPIIFQRASENKITFV